MKGLKVVKSFDTRIEAEVAKGFLETHKIPSVISADDEGYMNPFLGKTTGIKLFVREEDLKKALSFLRKVNK